MTPRVRVPGIMSRSLFLLLAATLAGCGAETATTAATGAAIKQKEIEEAKRTEERTRRQIDESLRALPQRTDKDGDR